MDARRGLGSSLVRRIVRGPLSEVMRSAGTSREHPLVPSGVKIPDSNIADKKKENGQHILSRELVSR